MKGVVVLAVCVGLAFFCWNFFLAGQFAADTGHWVPVAFGIPKDKTIQMHIAVAPALPMVDPPDIDEQNRPKWTEWIDSHFQLKDASGNKLRLEKMGTSGLFHGEMAAGAPEFALWTEIKKGEQYACDYIPNVRKGKRYRFEFTAPDTAQRVGLKSFDPAIGP